MLLDGAQALPGVLVEETHASVEGSTAPAFDRPIADLVELFKSGQHILQAHPGGGLRLVRVAQNGIGDLQFSHVRTSLAQELDQDAGRDSRADNAGHVRPHGVHEEEVTGIILLADLLGNAGGHGHGGHAGRTDEGVDLLLEEEIHELGEENAAGGRDREGADTHDDDLDGVQIQETVRRGGSANGDTQEDGNDVHQFILRAREETLAGARLLPQVTQHQAADQLSGRRHEQSHEDGDGDREDDLLPLADGAKCRHADGAFLLGGQHLHDGGLDDGHQGHIGVGRDGDGAKQLRRQLRSGEDGRRAVRSADNADGAGLLCGKAKGTGGGVGREDTDLRGRAQEQALRVGNQGAEVGHGADADEDQAGVEAGLDADVKDVEQSAAREDGAVVMEGGVAFVHEGAPQLGVIKVAAGQVGQQHTESDTNQKQGLELLMDAQPQQEEGDKDHHQVLPVVGEVTEQQEEAGAFEEFYDVIKHGELPALRRSRREQRRYRPSRPWSR